MPMREVRCAVRISSSASASEGASGFSRAHLRRLPSACGRREMFNGRNSHRSRISLASRKSSSILVNARCRIRRRWRWRGVVEVERCRRNFDFAFLCEIAVDARVVAAEGAHAMAAVFIEFPVSVSVSSLNHERFSAEDESSL